MKRIPNPPKISELEYNKYDNFDELLLKAMGILKEVNSKQDIRELPEKSKASSREIVKQHQYQLIESIINTDDESPCFVVITPIGNNDTWARIKEYDNHAKEYLSTNIVYLIDSERNIVNKVNLDTKIWYLSVHPNTKQMFCFSKKDRSVRRIDDTSIGKTVLKYLNVNLILTG